MEWKDFVTDFHILYAEDQQFCLDSVLLGIPALQSVEHPLVFTRLENKAFAHRKEDWHGTQQIPNTFQCGSLPGGSPRLRNDTRWYPKYHWKCTAIVVSLHMQMYIQ